MACGLGFSEVVHMGYPRAMFRLVVKALDGPGLAKSLVHVIVQV